MDEIIRIIDIDSSETEETLREAHKDHNSMDKETLKMLLKKALEKEFVYLEMLNIQSIEADRSIDLEIVSGTGIFETGDVEGNQRISIEYELNANGGVGEADYSAGVEVVISKM